MYPRGVMMFGAVVMFGTFFLTSLFLALHGDTEPQTVYVVETEDALEDVVEANKPKPENLLEILDTSENDKMVAQMQQENGPLKGMKEGDVFVPGSLTGARLEVAKRCWSDPALYKRRSMTCVVSEKYKLIIALIPKSGSSTGRHVVKHSFQGKEFVHKSCVNLFKNKGMYYFFSILRNPLSRGFASYEEMLVRSWGKSYRIPAQYREFMVPYDGLVYKDYSAKFDTKEGIDELTRLFEKFIALYDGKVVFDEHLSVQVPMISDPKTGLLYDLDSIFDTHKLGQQFEFIADIVNAPPPKIIRGRAYPRRMNVTDVSDETLRKVCKLNAIDYCCLNYELPPVCEEVKAVRCQLVRKPELTDGLLIVPMT